MLEDCRRLDLGQEPLGTHDCSEIGVGGALLLGFYTRLAYALEVENSCGQPRVRLAPLLEPQPRQRVNTGGPGHRHEGRCD